MIDAIVKAIEDCVKKSAGGLIIAAMAIEQTHMHLGIEYTGRDVEGTAKWIADQTTKAVHRITVHAGPVWCKRKWRSFIYDLPVWDACWNTFGNITSAADCRRTRIHSCKAATSGRAERVGATTGRGFTGNYRTGKGF
jgi:hypothetical protein